jgi:probable H4MPT-linked C1 transfer pathway protein
MILVAGYDLGGAHLKVATARDGRLTAVSQLRCPLWKGLDHLDAAFEQAAGLSEGADLHAITMTGELSDIFADRREGVLTLLERAEARLGPGVRVWAGPHGLVDLASARAAPTFVASTNYLATAALVARRLEQALLVDMGSTTVDIIPVRDGSPAAIGLTDAERLESGELVYTGLTRTPVMAIAQRAPFRGRWQGLTREYFATMADCRRILGDLPEGVDLHDTADSRGTSVEECVGRLARMFGRDAVEGSFADWRQAARVLADRQLRSMEDAAAQVLSASALDAAAPVVAAGIGAPVVAALAQRLGRPVAAFAELAGAPAEAADWAGRCAPATALALLAG